MTALFVFLGLVALTITLAFIIPLFMPKSYAIEKTITIKAPAEACFDKVADLNHYRDWNPWSQMEPDASKQITGAPKTVGHKYYWEGKKIGSGSLTVKKLVAHKNVELDLEFLRPWKSKADDIWTFEELDGNTKVTWKNHGPLAYPTARLLGPFITKNLSQQFEVGLSNIKKLCER